MSKICILSFAVSAKASQQQVAEMDLQCYLISGNYNRYHPVLLCEPTYPEAVLFLAQPVCFHITLGRFRSAVFSLHKQCLQSDPALIKGTNLSRSNQVAVLAWAADNSRLFDQKYIIFSRLPAWMPLSGARK